MSPQRALFSSLLYTAIPKFSQRHQVLFAILACIFLLHYAITGQAVYGDGIGYFAHLHSWVIDSDTDFSNEYRHVYNPVNNNSQEPLATDEIQIVATLANGRAGNLYSPGPALLLIPAYVLAYGLASLLQLMQIPVSMTGYGDVFQIAAGLFAVFLSSIGLYFLEQLLRKLQYSPAVAWWTTCTLLFSTHALYYFGYDVVNSHFAAFVVVSLFWYVAAASAPVYGNKSLLLGFLSGLAGSMRPQDSLLFVCAVLLLAATQNSEDKGYNRWQALANLCIGFAVGISPLVLHTITQFGSLVNHPYLADVESHLTQQSPHFWLGSIFHPVRGLLRGSAILGVLVLAAIARYKKTTWPLLLRLTALYFVLQVGIIELQGGWSAAAYGGRMYLSSMPFFALLLAQNLQLAEQKKRLAAAAGLLFFACLINFYSIAHFILLEKGTESGTPGIEVRTLQRILP